MYIIIFLAGIFTAHLASSEGKMCCNYARNIVVWALLIAPADCLKVKVKIIALHNLLLMSYIVSHTKVGWGEGGGGSDIQVYASTYYIKTIKFSPI